MTGATVLRILGWARVGFGLGLLVRPRLMSAGWVGRDEADRPITRVLLQSMGTRDAVLGYASLRTAEQGDAASRPLLTALALADAVDTVGWLVDRRLPTGRWIISSVGALGAALQLWVLKTPTAGETPPEGGA